LPELVNYSGRAVLRCVSDGDGRRSGALFGARAGAAGGTHSTGWGARLNATFQLA
jgi:hypothetical protein